VPIHIHHTTNAKNVLSRYRTEVVTEYWNIRKSYKNSNIVCGNRITLSCCFTSVCHISLSMSCHYLYHVLIVECALHLVDK